MQSALSWPTEQQQRAGVDENKIKANEIGIGQVTVSDGNK